MEKQWLEKDLERVKDQQEDQGGYKCIKHSSQGTILVSQTTSNHINHCSEFRILSKQNRQSPKDSKQHKSYLISFILLLTGCYVGNIL